MTERVLTLAGGFNFRELGGYQTRTGQHVVWHRLLRTAHLASLTDRDQRVLLDYGVRTVIDLRSTAEITQYPDQLPSGMRHVHVPVFDNDETESTASAAEIQRAFSASPEAGLLRMLYAYRRLVIHPAPQAAYRTFFHTLLTTPQGGIIFHCSAGKDRTGMCAILLLTALGVPEATIYQDYLATNAASTARVAERVAAAKRAHMNPCYLQSIRDLSSVRPEYYEQAMSLLNYEYGGVSAYLRDVVGLSSAEQAQLQAMYLE